ncbi:FISUMP domain-containing protein, partial [Fibrobacter sp.]|uniref:FISUMP domain-containing protein n=1 Tax=Fibrobacter sp. TaxID=35828 RepID=UPI0025BE97A1
VLQYDTYKQICSEFGQIVHGNVNADYAYFCYGDEWKRFYGNKNIVYGKLLDKRDGQIYRTVKIGDQTWMAENLNYSDSTNYPSMLGGNWCYNNDNDSCEKYGRFYNWSAAVDSIYWVSKGKKYERYGFLDMPTNVQGICPDGWMMPSSEQWNKLRETIEQVYDIQAKGFNVWDNAADLFGLAMLPAGEVRNDDLDYGMWTSPYYTMFWSVPEIGTNFIVSIDDAWIEDSSKCGGGCSVRCVKDEE